MFSEFTPGNITDLVSGTAWSGARLQDEAERRAAFLGAAGVGPGAIVLIAHGGTPFFFADLLAVWRTGAGAACLNQTLTASEIANVAAFVQPAALLAAPGGTPEDTPFQFPVFDLENDATEMRGTPPDVQRGGDRPALILFTSGTTGDPKGVVHTFDTIRARLQNNWRHLDGETLSRTLCPLPTHFGHGLIGNGLTPLLAGHDLFLYQYPGIRGAARLGPVVDENAITFLSSVPSFWRVVLKASPKPVPGTLRRVSVGSAPLSADLWEGIIAWAGTRSVFNMYGITETANWAAGASAAEFAVEDGLVGRMWGGEAAVVTADGTRAAVGTGEILLKTPSLMKGYYKRPDLTDKVIKDGWYLTGDFGVIGEDRVIRLRGRTKTEINKAGIKILPEEIDLLLEGHPEVAEACAFAVPDPISGETVAVALVLKSGAAASEKALRAWCGERLRRDAVPERWFFVGEIPKTERGKVNRSLVRDFCLGGNRG